jgi:hypothetical protein
MTTQDDQIRTCPTRIDGAEVLFAHSVTPPMCQKRQRELYHKCFTCTHNNALQASNGSGVSPTPAPATRPPLAGTPAARRVKVG